MFPPLIQLITQMIFITLTLKLCLFVIGLVKYWWFVSKQSRAG